MNNVYTSPKGKFVGFLKMALMVLVLVGTGVRGWGQTATYTVATTSTVTTSGTAPSGSSATYAQSFGTVSQMTSGNNAVLTLSGYAGYRITSIVLSMRSNAGGGSGNMTTVAGTTTIASIASNTFANAAWNGAYTTTYVNITPTITAYNIVGGNNVAITINATANSLYIQSYTITYTTSCSSPTTQASLLSTLTPTTDGFSANWTAGNGNGTMLVVRPTAQALVAPSSGTAYTPNVAWASAAQINTNNRVVFRAAGTSVGPLTGLTAGTQYTATAYEYSSTGDCYNTTSAPSSSIYTLSTEPTSHASTYSCNATAYNQINLSFSAASTTSGNGYLILQKIGSAPTGTPSDATAYTAGASLGDGTVAAIVNSNSATTQSITGLTASTNYYYTFIPFNWDGTNAGTYNYYTNATIPSTNCTTLVQPSSSSDITFNSASSASNNSNIAYTTYQSATISNTGSGANGSIGVMGFTVRDGGASGTDADALPTILNGISFNVTNPANIRSAALFNGSTFIANVAVGGVSPITFTGLSGANVTCTDDATLALNLRVTFNTVVTDNQKLVFTVASATAAAGSTSSLFAAADAGGAVSENTASDINRIEVTADRLAFLQGPSGATNGIAMTPAITVKAVDVNSNTDLDYVSAITLTCSTPAALTSGDISTAASGLATFNSVIHGTDGTYTMVASASGLTSTNNSSSYTISSVANGTWRTASGSTTAIWSSTAASSTVTWERMVSGSWVLQTLPTQPPTSGNANTVIIRHEVTLAGTNTHKDLIIANGGILNTSTVTATFGSLLVQTGGIFNRQGGVTFDATGTLEVEDGATFTFKQTNQNSRTSGIWAGTEKFHKNSNFEIVYSDATTLTILEAANDVSSYTDGTSTACFGNIIINCGTGSMQLIPSAFGTAGSPKQLTHQDLIFRANSDAKFAQGAFNAIIGRDLIIESGYNQALTLASTAVTATMSVRGNVTNNSAQALRLVNNAGGNVTLNVDGDINLNSTSTLDINFTTGGVSAVNLKGDIAVVSTATLTATAATVANNVFNFTGTGDGLTAATTQTIDIASTSANENKNMAFAVKSGAYVQQINRDFELGTNSGVTVENGGIFDFGFTGTTALLTKISASSTGTYFTSATGSTLKITSPDGITTTALLGNAQVTASNRTYNQTATFHYIGKVNQVTGNAITTGGTAKTIICDLLDNTKELSFTNSTSITTTGKLDIRTGKVIESTTAYLTGSTGSLTMATGTYYKIAKGNVDRTTSDADIVPRLTGTYTLPSGTIELSGTGASDAYQTLRGSKIYANLSFTNGGFKFLSSSITNTNYVKGTVLISDATILNVEGKTFGDATVASGNATNITMTGTSQYITDGTGTKPDAAGTYSLGAGTTIEFTNTGVSTENIRLAPSYYNIVVSGSSVANSSLASTPLDIQAGGSFTVTSTGVFKHANVNGFSGAANTTISTTNNPTITLAAGSTIDYYRGDGTAQNISNVANVGLGSSHYSNLYISGTGTKTAPSTTLSILGNIYKNSSCTFAHNNGTVSIDGTAAATQTYLSLSPPNMEFFNLINNNTNGGFTIAADLGVEKLLTLNNNSKLIFGSGNINIRSSATNTAAIAPVATTTAAAIDYTGTGRFQIERYLRAYKSWRFLATPIVGGAGSATINDSWREGGTALTANGYGTRITGPGGVALPGGVDEYTLRNSMKSYSMALNNYVEITSADLAANKTIANDEGYYVFVRGDRGVDVSGAAGTTNLRIKGKIRTGDQTYNVNAGAFQSVGNPFASQLNYKTISNASVAEAFTIWNPNGGYYGVGQYESYVKDLNPPNDFKLNGTGAVLNTIESGQAFFIQSLSAGSITIEEADKLTGSNLVSRESEQGRVGVISPTLEINLHTNDVNNNDFVADAVMLNFDNAFSSALDNKDVKKILNSNDNLFIKKGSANLVAERRPNLTVNDTIQLGISGSRVAAYHFEIDPSVLGNLPLAAFLKDKFLQTETPVSLTSVTNINFSITSDAASKAADRFMIVFRTAAAGPLPVRFISIAAAKNADKTIAVKWNIANEINMQQYQIERSEKGTNFTSIGNALPLNNTGGNYSYLFEDASPLATDNYYRIKAISVNGTVQYSAIVKVLADVNEPFITVSPNPVQNKTIQLQMGNQAKGLYNLQLVNNVGQTVFKGTITINNFIQTNAIELDKNIAAGNYKLMIVSANGDKTVKQIFVQ